MKLITHAALMLVLVCSGGRQAVAAPKQDNPCPAATKAEERVCFARAQERINKEVDMLAIVIAATLRRQADEAGKSSSVNSATLHKAALEMTASQAAWKTYRDHYCRAVMYSFTDGAGARTAYDACLFDVATSRMADLRGYFGDGH